MATLDDCFHLWGGDLQLSTTGDLLRTNGLDRSKQHVFRRLLTNVGEYLDHTKYGAGVPSSIGTLLNIPELTAQMRAQMRLEPSVSPFPEPAITLTPTARGVRADITYTALPDRQPAILTFSVEA